MNWYGLGKCAINLDNVLSIDKKDEDKIEIFFAGSNSLTSKIITFENEKDRDNAFKTIYKYVLDLDEEDDK